MKRWFSHSLSTVALVAGLGAATPALAQGAPELPRLVGVPIKPDAKTAVILKQREDLLGKMSPVTDAMLANPPPGEWLQWLRTYDLHGFSPLDQINKENVASLRPAWTWSLPQGTSEGTPLVHDGILFIYGAGDRMQALDAVTGDLLWEFTRPPRAGAPANPQVLRNFSIYGDKVYLSAPDGHLIALEAKTGKMLWDKEIVGAGYRISAGPVAIKGKLIQGITSCGGLQPGGCFVLGLDANDGKELWRFNTLARPGEPGGNSWNGLPVEQRNGGSVWTTPAYDSETDTLYIGTGNTYNWQALAKGAPTKPRGATKEGLHLNSTIALDPNTGKMKWAYPHFPEEPWDLDWAFERQLITLPVQGRDRKLVVTMGKAVIYDALDRETGKWAFSKDLGIQNVVTKIDQRTGKKTYDPLAMPDLTGERNNLQCPAGYGAKNWPSNSFNDQTKVSFVPLAEVCGETSPRLYKSMDEYKGGGQEQRMARYHPNSDGNVGRIDAVNLATRETVWTVRQRASVTSATLATAGGVMFVGDADRYFRAYDQATGNVLWEMRLNDAINAYPISYSVNGKQYVAVAAGFGGPRIANLRQLTTEVNTPRGGGAALWVFELPSAR